MCCEVPSATEGGCIDRYRYYTITRDTPVCTICHPPPHATDCTPPLPLKQILPFLGRTTLPCYFLPLLLPPQECLVFLRNTLSDRRRKGSASIDRALRFVIRLLPRLLPPQTTPVSFGTCYVRASMLPPTLPSDANNASVVFERTTLYAR